MECSNPSRASLPVLFGRLKGLFSSEYSDGDYYSQGFVVLLASVSSGVGSGRASAVRTSSVGPFCRQLLSSGHNASWGSRL